jgi:hypothetical protein
MRSIAVSFASSTSSFAPSQQTFVTKTPAACLSDDCVLNELQSAEWYLT